MPKCYICNDYDPKKVSLFRIPNRNDEYSERSGLWLKLLDEKSANVHKIRICSEHFLRKKPAKGGDHLDLDWVPNKNLGRFSKNWKRIEYHFRKRFKNPTVQDLHLQAVNETGNVQQDTNMIVANTNNIDLIAVTNNDNMSNNNFNVVTNNDDLKVSADKSGLKNNDNLSNNNFNVVTNNDDLKVSADKSGLKNNDNLRNNNFNVVTNNDDLKVSANKSGLNDFNLATNNDLIVAAGNNKSALNNSTKYFVRSSADRSSQVSQDALQKVLIAAKKRKIEIIQQQFFFSKDIQTDLSSIDIDLLFKHYKESVEERNALLKKMLTVIIDVDFFKGNNKKTRFYTGLPTWTLLNNFFEMIEEFLPTHFNCKLSRFQMVVLTLMKLRLNLSFTDLGYRFQIDETTASRYFYRCIYILFKLFEKSKLVHWPEERSNLLMNTPSYFRSTFKESITIIVDCFEIFIERSSLLRALAQAFSHYKHHATLKYMIGISITGAILFVSRGYGGRASDKEVVYKSGFLEKLKQGDVVLADKGFLIEDAVEAKGSSLKIPSFVRNGNQLHPTEIEQYRDYSRIRIHVERLICLLREKYNICSDIAQMSAVSKQNDLFDNDLYDKIIFVCSCLVNICPSVVLNDFEM